jgi:vacuolar-type H+-ATPase subunit H
MTVELEGLIEKVKEANSLKDNEAKQKAQEEMRKVSSEIYKLTDEVTEKNEGKLPEGWWGK